MLISIAQAAWVLGIDFSLHHGATYSHLDFATSFFNP